MKKINIIILVSIVFLFSSCERSINIGCLDPDGDVETRTLNFDDFSDITIAIPSITEITQGNNHEVIIEASSNIIDRIDSDSRKSGNDLDIEINGCVKFDEDEILIRITVPTLEAIKIEGTGTVVGTNTFTTSEDIKTEVEGTGTITLDIEGAVVVAAKIEGTGEIILEGSCQELKAEIEGTGEIDTDELTAQIVLAKIEGTGDIRCNVNEEIKIDIDGTGSVRASGVATTQEIKIEGAGSVRNFNLEADDTDVDIRGFGEVEVTCLSTLSVNIQGGGDVCYRGNPTIGELNIDGLGQLSDCN